MSLFQANLSLGRVPGQPEYSVHSPHDIVGILGKRFVLHVEKMRRIPSVLKNFNKKGSSMLEVALSRFVVVYRWVDLKAVDLSTSIINN